MNLLDMSISAGFLIFLIVIVRVLAINKLPKTMFVALWGIALCRLIIPFSIPSKFSIFNGIISGIREGLFLKSGQVGVGAAVPMPSGNMAFIKPAVPGLNFGPILSVWAAGTIILAVFFILSLRKSRCEIRTALPARGCEPIDRWLSAKKIKRSLKVLVSDRISTPLTYGIIKPRIVLPAAMDFADESQMQYILAHEMVHIKRFDALWKLLMVAVLCLYWFNPMVWILYVLMNRDLEMSCDEKVIRLFGEDTRSAYALSLIGMAERGTVIAPLCSSFSRNAIEERVVSIMKFKKTSLAGLVLAFVMVAGAASVFAESAANVFRISGVIQKNGVQYSFDIDEKGTVTIRNSEGKVLGTTTVGSDGSAILTDGGGNIIARIETLIPGIQIADVRLFRSDGMVTVPVNGGSASLEGIFIIRNNGAVTVSQKVARPVSPVTVSEGSPIFPANSRPGQTIVQNAGGVRNASFAMKINGTSDGP